MNIYIIFAQRPENIPYDTGPVNFIDSPFNIVIFVVLPILLVIFYFWWIAKKRKEKEKEDNEKNQ